MTGPLSRWQVSREVLSGTLLDPPPDRPAVQDGCLCSPDGPRPDCPRHAAADDARGEPAAGAAEAPVPVVPEVRAGAPQVQLRPVAGSPQNGMPEFRPYVWGASRKQRRPGTA